MNFCAILRRIPPTNTRGILPNSVLETVVQNRLNSNPQSALTTRDGVRSPSPPPVFLESRGRLGVRSSPPRRIYRKTRGRGVVRSSSPLRFCRKTRGRKGVCFTNKNYTLPIICSSMVRHRTRLRHKGQQKTYRRRPGSLVEYTSHETLIQNTTGDIQKTSRLSRRIHIFVIDMD